MLPLRACLPTTTPVRESRTVFCMATRMHGAGGLAHWVRASFRRPEFASQHPSQLTATWNSSSKGSHALCWLLWAPSHAHAHKIELEKQCSIINRQRLALVGPGDSLLLLIRGAVSWVVLPGHSVRPGLWWGGGVMSLLYRAVTVGF